MKIGTLKILLLALMVIQVGCSLDASIIGTNVITGPVIVQQSKTSNKEIVPSSQQGVVTAKGYTVQSSIGYHSGKLVQVTSKNYTVSTSVQSTLFKGTP
jgi:hypothetical protein